LRIHFMHPRLGLGGAERWVIDTALALQAMGHAVTVFTTAYDPARSFADCRALDIRVLGHWVPHHVLHRLKAPCTIFAMAWLVVALRRRSLAADLLICDISPHVIGLLDRRLYPTVLYYGHYPDRLLTPPRRGLYRGYRVPLDRLEVQGLLQADHILVNSRFTEAAFRAVFPALAARPIGVAHPGIDARPFVAIAPLPADLRDLDCIDLLTLGRFHPDKNLMLAVETLARLCPRLGEIGERVRLTLAGGFDRQDRANQRVVDQLACRIADLGLARQVELHFNPSDDEKIALYRRACALLHTATAEHFGLVPLEAMAASRPVIASRIGGPRETVLDGETGLLCDATPEAFAAAVARLVMTPALAREQGLAGRARVRSEYRRELCAAAILNTVAGVETAVHSSNTTTASRAHSVQ
jgi:alpha-1,3/alpha-1,6-mannosyltransferase